MKEKCFCCGANTECKPMIVSPFRNKMCMSCIMTSKNCYLERRRKKNDE